MDTKKLVQFIAKAPREPGIYTWRDSRGRPLYIGKAANIKSRLSNYPKATDSRIQLMISDATSIKWHITETEIEALILESREIKARRPKYNIVMRDDKQYSFVGFTDSMGSRQASGDFPRIFTTHQPVGAKKFGTLPTSDTFIGPFTDAAALKATLRVLRGLFPYCTCKQQHHVRCLNAHIGKCPGYCCLRAPATAMQRAAYKKNIRAITDILSGKRENVIRRIETEMKTRAATGRLEEAIALQKQLARVQHVFENAQINARHQKMASQHLGALAEAMQFFGLTHEPTRIEGYDIANIQQQIAGGAMIVFADGRADREQYRLFNIRTTDGGDTAMLSEMLERRIKHDEWPRPNLIVIDGGKAQLNAAYDVIGATPVVAITKNDKHQADRIQWHAADGTAHDTKLSTLPRALRDLLVHVDGEAHRFAISHYRKRHRKELTKSR